jgi:hypothetical protein
MPETKEDPVVDLAAATLDAAEQWIIIHGDVVEGFALIGPFPSPDTAASHAQIAFASEPWTVAALVDPAILDKTQPAGE